MIVPPDAAAALATSAAMARALGVTPASVRRLAKQHGIGRLVTPRLRLFAPADLARLRAVSHGTPGRPRKPKSGP